MKIAVVDDGVDPTNRFFNPEGYTYPAGFPKGGRKWTTPKVIVARSFVGAARTSARRWRSTRKPRSTARTSRGSQPATPARPHPRAPTIRRRRGLSGVAPRAQIGNYRVFNVPTPVGHVGNTPEIVAAFEAAVRDGMDVINFSGGGPQTDPASDAIIEAVRNVAAAGVVPVISAGNDRDEYGLGSAGSPGTAPDAISVAAALERARLRSGARVTASEAPDVLTRIPFVRTAGAATPAGRWATPTRSWSMSGRSWARAACPCLATSAARPATSTAARPRSPRAR